MLVPPGRRCRRGLSLVTGFRGRSVSPGGRTPHPAAQGGDAGDNAHGPGLPHGTAAGGAGVAARGPDGPARAALGPHAQAGPAHRHHPWWRVMCLTGVDYFSTLGYQPGIAALAAGLLSPIATVVLVVVTLAGALPVYRRVAQESSHGEGSIAMLERLLTFWKGKLFVLTLLGFAATDFLITITLSAADATAHVVENPHVPGRAARPRGRDHPGPGRPAGRGVPQGLHRGDRRRRRPGRRLPGAQRRRGRWSACGTSITAAHVVTDWTTALTAEHGNPLLMVGLALLVFPKLALGLSGFETGVAVMPHVQGDPDDTEERPAGRIRGTKKLLTTAAVIMSVLPDHHQLHHDPADPAAGVRARRAGQRPRAGLPRPRVPGQRLRHRLRPVHHRHPVVRRRLRDGRAAQPHAALPAPLRHGPALGPRRPPDGAGLHRRRLPGHLDLRRRRGRPGRRLRHRRPRPDHLRRRSP